MKDKIWVISKGKSSKIDVSQVFEDVSPSSVKEYEISEFGRYLLCPTNIRVAKKLIGCEVHYYRTLGNKIRSNIRSLFPMFTKFFKDTRRRDPEVLLNHYGECDGIIRTSELKKHLEEIVFKLKPYMDITKRINNLDKEAVADIIAVVEEPDGNSAWVPIDGDVGEKIDFILRNIAQNVNILRRHSYLKNGNFELRGFDFSRFNPEKSYKMLKFVDGNFSKACIVNPNNTVEYTIDDMEILNYLNLLESSIESSKMLRESMILCRQGKAKPFSLYFNRKPNIDFKHAYLPQVYKTILESYGMGIDERDELLDVLNSNQIGIVFNYLKEPREVYTSISLMHDVKALEPIKDSLPKIYEEINKRASVTDVGKLYLLDATRGRRK